MESLLLERSLGKIPFRSFEKLITESNYFNLEALDYPKFPLKSKPSSINSLDFDKSEGKFLLSGGADSSIRLWEIGTRRAKPLGSVSKANGGHSFGVTGVLWWPFDTGMFLSSSYDKTLRVWDTNKLEEAFSFDLDSKVNCFDVSTTGRHSLIAAGSESSHVRILDLNTTSAVHSLSGHAGMVLSCKWSTTDPHVLATGTSEGEVRLWDIRRPDSCVTQLDLYRTEKDYKNPGQVNKSRKLGIFKNSVNAHAGAVNGMCWLENGKSLITTGHDEKIRVWNLDVNGGLNTLLNFGPFVKNRYFNTKSMILSPLRETEVQFLWYPSDNGEILVFRLQGGKLVTRLRRGLQENSRSTCLTYEGRNTATYYSGTVDGRINVWGPKEEVIADEMDECV